MSGLQWTIDGKSVVSSWGAYGLRVKRLSKGKYWWVVTGVLQGKRSVKLKDGIARNGKEGRNEAEAALCQISGDYVKGLVARRTQGIEWFERIKEFTPRVGRRLIKATI